MSVQDPTHCLFTGNLIKLFANFMHQFLPSLLARTALLFLLRTCCSVGRHWFFFSYHIYIYLLNHCCYRHNPWHLISAFRYTKLACRLVIAHVVLLCLGNIFIISLFELFVRKRATLRSWLLSCMYHTNFSKTIHEILAILNIHYFDNFGRRVCAILQHWH